MEKYIPVKSNEKHVTHIKVRLSYNLGGCNPFTYQNEPRGYYLSVSPVERMERYGVVMESIVAFSGVKKLLKSVSRKSEKSEKEAEILAQNEENEMIQYILSESGVELAV